jgi:hypothetical protein
MHKTKVFKNNILKKYFDIQLKASTKQLKWHMVVADFIFKLLYVYLK